MASAKMTISLHPLEVKVLHKQFSYVASDIQYLNGFMSRGYAITYKEISRYLTILMLIHSFVSVPIWEEKQMLEYANICLISRHYISIVGHRVGGIEGEYRFFEGLH